MNVINGSYQNRHPRVQNKTNQGTAFVIDVKVTPIECFNVHKSRLLRYHRRETPLTEVTSTVSSEQSVSGASGVAALSAKEQGD